MGKKLYITEKPSVAASFAQALGLSINRTDRSKGYAESGDTVIAWCYGHLVTMAFPDAYDPEYKKWRVEHLPIIPGIYKYTVIDEKGNKAQYAVLKELLNRKDIDEVIACTDSGREGEYIFRLVYAQSKSKKPAKRVWISAQTEEAVKKGIAEAKDIHAYDNLAKSAYCRAKEDWLFGMNFSRLYTCQYGRDLSKYLHVEKSSVIAIGRVMTCVLGLVVEREMEISHFVPKINYGVMASFHSQDSDISYKGRWQEPKEKKTAALKVTGTGAGETNMLRADPDTIGTGLHQSEGNDIGGDSQRLDVRDAGADGSVSLSVSEKKGKSSPVEKDSDTDDAALTKEDAQLLIDRLTGKAAFVRKVDCKEKAEPAPYLFNLAELQSEANKRYKMPVDRVLEVAQSLYEKKLISYPRTDSRVISTEVVPELPKILNGLFGSSQWHDAVLRIKSFGPLAVTKTIKRFVDDTKITDHYAIIPTYAATESGNLDPELNKIYELIVKRFLAIFYPAAVYNTVRVETDIAGETFLTNAKTLKTPGWKEVYDVFTNKSDEDAANAAPIHALKKKEACDVTGFELEEKETKPPPRFTDGSMILTMEKAGKYIDNEELRAQMKGSGIGTSATRSSIIKKLCDIGYIQIQKKTQIISPTKKGEAIVSLVRLSAKELLNPTLTASWEKGLTMVQNGETTEAVFQEKLDAYLRKTIDKVKHNGNAGRQLGRI